MIPRLPVVNLIQTTALALASGAAGCGDAPAKALLEQDMGLGSYSGEGDPEPWAIDVPDAGSDDATWLVPDVNWIDVGTAEPAPPGRAGNMNAFSNLRESTLIPITCAPDTLCGPVQSAVPVLSLNSLNEHSGPKGPELHR